MANENKYIYVKASGQKVFVTEEEYKVFYREVERVRSYERYHERCLCPKEKRWYCDAECEDCRYWNPSSQLDYFDMPVSEENNGATKWDTICSTNGSRSEAADAAIRKSCVDKIFEDTEYLNELFDKLRQLDSAADIIIDAWMENPDVSDREIARRLGRKPSTFAGQLKRYRKILKEIFE